MESSLLLRPALESDLEELTRVAHAAKRHWGYPEEWIVGWRSDLTVTVAELSRFRIICAVEGGRLVGFVAISGDGSRQEVEHLWVDPPAMRRGIGSRLLERAARDARRHGARVLEIVSDPHAEPFYRSRGAVRVGEEPSTPTGRLLPVLELRLSA